MKKLFAALSCTAIAFGLSAVPAVADTFSFSIPGTVDPGSGTLTATAVAGEPGVFLVTSITGTIDNQAITGLLAPGTYPSDPNPNPQQNFSNDDLIYSPPSSQLPYTIGGAPGQNAYVDIRGVSVVVAGMDYNLYYGSFGVGSPIGYNVTYGPTLSSNDVLAGFNLTDLSVPTVTPEPSSFVLLGTGLVGFAGVVRRRLTRTA